MSGLGFFLLGFFGGLNKDFWLATAECIYLIGVGDS